MTRCPFLSTRLSQNSMILSTVRARVLLPLEGFFTPARMLKYSYFLNGHRQLQITGWFPCRKPNLSRGPGFQKVQIVFKGYMIDGFECEQQRLCVEITYHSKVTIYATACDKPALRNFSSYTFTSCRIYRNSRLGSHSVRLTPSKLGGYYAYHTNLCFVHTVYWYGS